MDSLKVTSRTCTPAETFQNLLPFPKFSFIGESYLPLRSIEEKSKYANVLFQWLEIKFIFTGGKTRNTKKCPHNVFMFLHLNIQEKNSQFTVNSYTITCVNVPPRGTTSTVSGFQRMKKKKKVWNSGYLPLKRNKLVEVGAVYTLQDFNINSSCISVCLSPIKYFVL